MLAVLATALVLAAGVADARPGGGGSSFGSRGWRTFQAPPSTTTAPRSAAPIERSMTQPSRPSTTGTPGVQRPATAPGGFFSRGGGFFSGLMGGLLGAGLAGLLFGHGFFGGMGGFASILGLLLQIVLVVVLVRLAINFFRRRSEPAYQGASGPVYREAAGPEPGYGASGYGGRMDAPPAAERSDALSLDKSDYDEFERLLGEIQTAYGREDLAALQRLATPEMVSYFAEELAGYASRGLVSRVSDVKLLQGDLAEAWREGNVEYATVAMRFSLIDALVDRATGRVAEGSLTTPTEVTEVWTFMRTHGGRWLLSAIQQA